MPHEANAISKAASGRYRTIVADPPWHYDGFAKGRPGWRMGGEKVAVRTLPYASMSLDEIAALPISDLADPSGAWLFLWTTNRYLHDAFHVAEAWGFRYRQTVIWDKGDCVPLGGCITTNTAEFLLVCRRGQANLIGRWKGGSVVRALKGTSTGSHSAKPEAFLDIVETVSPGPYLELFARRQRLGWDTWGNEALNHVELTA